MVYLFDEMISPLKIMRKIIILLICIALKIRKICFTLKM
jgi:hypothetical protein